MTSDTYQYEVIMLERLADADRNFIKSQVSAGFYTSEIEVVRDAMRKMREEKERIARFHAAVAKGEQDIQEGRTQEFTQDVMDEIIENGLARAKAGLPYHSQDAVPHNEA
jgi:antitoxin ParD1/3/4